MTPNYVCWDILIGLPFLKFMCFFLEPFIAYHLTNPHTHTHKYNIYSAREADVLGSNHNECQILFIFYLFVLLRSILSATLVNR